MSWAYQFDIYFEGGWQQLHVQGAQNTTDIHALEWELDSRWLARSRSAMVSAPVGRPLLVGGGSTAGGAWAVW